MARQPSCKQFDLAVAVVDEHDGVNEARYEVEL